MGAEEVGNGRLDVVEVEGVGKIGSVEAIKWVDDGIEVEVVVVDLSGGAVSGVEGVGDGFDLVDADCGGEEGVEGEEGALGVDALACGKVGNLSTGMDAGVCPSGTCDVEGLFAENRLEGLLQVALDGGGVRLDLPAAKGSSIVADEEFILLLFHGSGGPRGGASLQGW